MEKRPNLIFINVDQMRADCLGVAGHPVIETPNLDCIAKQGVRFTQAYSAVPSCIAARVAILTGLSQRAHGRPGYEDGITWKYNCTLPGELAKNNYHTQGVGKMHFYPPRNLCGFHNVVLHDGYLHHQRYKRLNYELYDDYTPWLKEKSGSNFDLIDHGLDSNSWVARPWPYPEYLHPTNWVVTQSIDFLRRRDPEKPFFLWMSFVRPHAPLDPPKVYFDQYINQDIPLPSIGDWANKQDKDGDGFIINARKGKINKKALHRAMAAYYALITHIDHQIGRFFEVLDEYEQTENTFIIFASDHGELLGDHNLFRKGLPYDGSARVPFLIRLSENMKKYRHSVIDKPVELRDIMPTFLDIANIPIPKTVDGKSLLSLIKSEKCEWREYIHGEHSSFGYDTGNQYVTDGKEKYIWFTESGKEQIFNLKKDPKELNNLANNTSSKKKLEYWRNILMKELKGREERFTDGKKLYPKKENQ